jgi:hypothetical protein
MDSSNPSLLEQYTFRIRLLSMEGWGRKRVQRGRAGSGRERIREVGRGDA